MKIGHITFQRKEKFVIMLYICQLISSVGRMLLGPSLTSIMYELKISAVMAGLFSSLFAAGTIFSFLGGWFGDRINRVKVTTIGLSIFALCSLLIALSLNDVMLYLLFFILGFSAAIAQPTVMVLLMEAYPNIRGRAINYFSTYWNVGSFVGPLLAGYMAISPGGWRFSYLIVSLFLFPTTFILYILGRKVIKEAGSSKSSISVVQGDWSIPKKLVILVIFATFLYLGAEVSINMWLTTILTNQGLGFLNAALSTSLFGGFMGVGRITVGTFTDKVGYRRSVILYSIAASTTIGLSAFIGNPILKIASWGLVGFLCGPIVPSLWAWASSLQPKRAGFLLGLASSFGALGLVFSSLLIGQVIDVTGNVNNASNLIAALIAITAFIAFINQNKHQMKPT